MTAPVVEAAAPARLDIEVCRDLLRSVGVSRAQLNDNGMPTMDGHFSMFNTWYEIDSWFEGRFLERIAPGAFRKTFKENGSRIRVLLEHGYDPTVGDKPLGVPRSLTEDELGAAYEVPLFDTSYNRDLVPALEAGAYGASFRFRVIKDEWVREPPRSDDNPEGLPERTIREVAVAEFGPTVFPASPTTTAGLRSATDRYYEALRARNPDRYDAIVRSLNRTAPPAAPQPVSTPAAESTGAEPEPAPEPQPAAATPAEPRVSHSDSPQTTVIPRSAAVPTTMSVEEREERQNEIRSRLAEIDAEYDGAELPDEARTEFNTLTAEFDTNERAIADSKARRAAIEARAARATETGENRGVERPVTGAPNVNRSRSDADIYDLGALRKQARSIDDMAQLYRDNAMRAVERARYGLKEGQRREDAQAQVERLLDTVDDEHGTLARRILATGSPVYERAFGKALLARSVAGLSAEEQRALSLGTDTEGGYAVPFQLDPTVMLTSAGSVNPLRQVARVETIVGKTWQGVTSAGITVARSAERAEATDNAPSLAQPEVTPTRVLAFVPFTMELEADWQRMRAELTPMLADAKDDEEAASFTTGSGTGVNPQGLITGVSAVPASVKLQTGAAGSLTVPADVFLIEEDLGPRFRKNGSYLGNKSIYNLIRRQATAAGIDDLWTKLTGNVPPELNGYPARELSTMDGAIATAGAVDNYVLAFGDFKAGFMIVDRVGMQIELVPHLFGAANRFPTGERGVMAYWRNSSVVQVPQAIRLLNVKSPA